MSAWGPETSHGTLVRAVAAHGLAGSTLTLPDRPLPDGEFARLLREVKAQRVTGLLWQAVLEGALPTTQEQASRAEWTHTEVLAGVLALERLLLDTVAALRAAEVPVRVLKGSAHAHLDYPDPSWRTFGDIDLLVHGADFDYAVKVIKGRGHPRLHPEPRPGFDARFSKGTSFRTDQGLEIDLHRTFTMGPYGVRLDTATLWDRADNFTLGGWTLAALAPEERFFHACYHAVLSGTMPRLVPLRDIAQLALAPALDFDRVHQLARASGGEPVVSRAVRQAWHALALADVLSISAWAESYRADSREDAELAVYQGRTSYARKSVAAIRALPRWRDRAAYVHALTFPNSSYLGTRHTGRLGRLRTGLAQSTSLRRSP